MAQDTPHIHVEFINLPVENKAKSREQGRPIFEDKEFCRIRWTGDNKRELVEPAHQQVDRDPQTNLPRSYAQKFPEHYRLFKADQDQAAVNGTPLSEVPFLTESKRAELRALNIVSLEGLASLDGAMLQRLGMGGRELKNQAQAWIDKANGAASESKLASELAARDDQIEAMQRQISELTALLTRPAAPAPANAQDVDEGPWADYSDEDIKAFIADRQGRRPAGNPKRETLIEQANEIIAAEKASEAA